MDKETELPILLDNGTFRMPDKTIFKPNYILINEDLLFSDKITSYPEDNAKQDSSPNCIGYSHIKRIFFKGSKYSKIINSVD